MYVVICEKKSHGIEILNTIESLIDLNLCNLLINK